MQKKYRFFKKSSSFYRNSSVTKRPKRYSCVAFLYKISQVQQFPHTFRDTSVRFVLYIAVFICIALHIVVSVYAFVALRCVPFCVPFLWSKSEPLCSTRHNSSLIKNTKKRPLHKKCATASHNSGYAIELCSGQMITEQPLLPRSA